MSNRGRPFTKDDSRINRKGRPKNRLQGFQEKVRRLLESKKIVGENGETERQIDEIIQVAINQAINGDDKAREWLCNYGYGRAPLRAEVDPLMIAVGITQEGLDALEKSIMGDDDDEALLDGPSLSPALPPPIVEPANVAEPKPEPEPIFEVVP
jgi:hypothetical protein